jgi:NAD+ synthase (glutamine-hydrolysing)
VAPARRFEEKLVFAQVQPRKQLSEMIAMWPPCRPEADLWDALVLGVRDYVGKNGFPGVLLGLSGGIDSALVLAIAWMRWAPTRCAR